MRSLTFVGIRKPLKVFEQENDMAELCFREITLARRREWIGLVGGGKTRDGRIFRSLLQESTGQEVIKVVLGSYKYGTYCSEKSTGLID